MRSAWAQQSASLGSGVEELGLPLQQYWSAPVYCDEHCSGKFFGGGGRECPPPPL